MKHKNVRDKGRKGEYEHPERYPKGKFGRIDKDFDWWFSTRNGKRRCKKYTYATRKDGTKIYWLPYNDEYVKIVGTGEIVRKENLEKYFGEHVIEEMFIENI